MSKIKPNILYLSQQRKKQDTASLKFVTHIHFIQKVSKYFFQKKGLVGHAHSYQCKTIPVYFVLTVQKT
jgi:hypothetical protein